MWLEESDPDDVYFIGEHEEACNCEKNDAEEETTDDDSDSDGEEEETDDEEEEIDEEEPESSKQKDKGVENEKDKKRKGKKKKKDEEDIFERFEFEVAKFVDELFIGRRKIPPSRCDEDLGRVQFRDRRIRRRQIEKLVIGNYFLSGIELKGATLDYALSSCRNIKRQRSEKYNIGFKCGIGGKCKWRVYCSWDTPSQLWLMKITYLYHACISNGKCKLLKAPMIARLFLDKRRMNPDYMPKDIQIHIKEQWKFVSSRGQCQRGRKKHLRCLTRDMLPSLLISGDILKR